MATTKYAPPIRIMLPYWFGPVPDVSVKPVGRLNREKNAPAK
jgi:hypothetical protein